MTQIDIRYVAHFKPNFVRKTRKCKNIGTIQAVSFKVRKLLLIFVAPRIIRVKRQ